MVTRTSLPFEDQMSELRAFIRILRADYRRGWREADKHYLRRRITPFAHHLRYLRIDYSRELEKVAEECLQDLAHARDLEEAEFFPGDQVTVEVVLKGFERGPERQIVYDVKRCYEMWQLTKGGILFKAGPRSVCLSSRIKVRPCSDPLPDETQRRAEDFRQWARQFVEQARDQGKLEPIVDRVRKREKNRLWP